MANQYAIEVRDNFYRVVNCKDGKVPKNAVYSWSYFRISTHPPYSGKALLAKITEKLEEILNIQTDKKQSLEDRADRAGENILGGRSISEQGCDPRPIAFKGGK